MVSNSICWASVWTSFSWCSLIFDNLIVSWSDVRHKLVFRFVFIVFWYFSEADSGVSRSHSHQLFCTTYKRVSHVVSLKNQTHGFHKKLPVFSSCRQIVTIFLFRWFSWCSLQHHFLIFIRTIQEVTSNCTSIDCRLFLIRTSIVDDR